MSQIEDVGTTRRSSENGAHLVDKPFPGSEKGARIQVPLQHQIGGESGECRLQIFPPVETQHIGSGFGTKSQAAPWVWDDFENGTEGAQLNTSPTVNWSGYSGGGGDE